MSSNNRIVRGALLVGAITITACGGESVTAPKLTDTAVLAHDHTAALTAPACSSTKVIDAACAADVLAKFKAMFATGMSKKQKDDAVVAFYAALAAQTLWFSPPSTGGLKITGYTPGNQPTFAGYCYPKNTAGIYIEVQVKAGATIVTPETSSRAKQVFCEKYGTATATYPGGRWVFPVYGGTKGFDWVQGTLLIRARQSAAVYSPSITY